MDIFTLLALFLLAVIAYFSLRYYWEQFEIDSLQDKAVLITGCDTGFGRGLALKCLGRGMPVFAGCLSEQGCSSLRAEAKGLKGILDAFVMNVSSDESVAKTKEYLVKKTEQYGGLYGVANNAGIVGNSFFDDFLNIDDYKAVAEVNTFGVIRTTHAVKDMIKRKRGRIVNVHSICARVGIQGIGPYTVAKFAVSGYTDVLRQEMRPFGVSVHCLEPGFFKTPLIDHDRLEKQVMGIWERAPQGVRQQYGEECFRIAKQKMQELLEGISSSRVDWVVDAYFHALTAKYPRTRYQIGYDCHFLFIPLSFVPSALQDRLLSAASWLSGAPKPQCVDKM